MHVLYALVVIFFANGSADVHVVDRLSAEDCIAALNQHDTESVGVWGCTLDYDY